MVNIEHINRYGAMSLAADRLIFPGLEAIDIHLDAGGGDPPFTDRAQALGWMKSQRPRLTAAWRDAAQHHAHSAAIALGGTARFLSLQERSLWPLRAEAESLGLDAARALQNREAEALLLGFRGDTHADMGLLSEAEEDFAALLEMAAELSEVRHQRVALAGLGQIRRRQDRHSEAQSYYQQALSIAMQIHDVRGQAVAHGNLSAISAHLGEYAFALAHAGHELMMRRQADDTVGEAYALHDLAVARQGLGDHDDAVDLADQAVAMFRTLEGADQYAATAMQVAATSLEHLGDRERATACLAEASRILAGHEDPQVHVVEERLARLTR